MANHQAEIARAANARRLLEDPMYTDAWHVLIARAERKLLDGPFEDAQDLVRARTEREWLLSLRREFETHITTGKMAERQIKNGR